MLHPLGCGASELIGELQRDVPMVDRVLEIGTGDGRNLSQLLTLGKEVVGVDISKKAIEIAKSLAKSAAVELHTCSGDTLPLPDESCDLVVAIDLMNHLDEPARFCSEVRRVLKSKGVFIGNATSTSDPSRNVTIARGTLSAWGSISVLWNGIPNQEPAWLTMRYYDEPELRKLFHDFVWIAPPSEYTREDLGHPLPFDSAPHKHVFWKLHLRKRSDSMPHHPA